MKKWKIVISLYEKSGHRVMVNKDPITGSPFEFRYGWRPHAPGTSALATVLPPHKFKFMFVRSCGSVVSVAGVKFDDIPNNIKIQIDGSVPAWLVRENVTLDQFELVILPDAP